VSGERFDRPYIGVLYGGARHAGPRSARQHLRALIERYRNEGELSAAVEEHFEGGTILVLETGGDPAVDALALIRQLDALVLRPPFDDRHAAAKILDTAHDAGVEVYALLEGQLMLWRRAADFGLPPVEQLTGRQDSVLLFYRGEGR
jgi:hypothetical protein